MKTAKRVNHPRMLEQIKIINELLSNQQIYFINFSSGELWEFNVHEVQAVFSKNNVQFEIIDEYIPPILFITSPQIISLKQLGDLCLQLSQVSQFGQVLSLTEAPNEYPSLNAREALLSSLSTHFPQFDQNNLNIEEGRPKFSMLTNVIGINWQHNQKLNYLNSFFDSINIKEFNADIKNPDFHISLIYDYISNPSRYLIGLRLSTSEISLRKFLQKFDLPHRKFIGPTSMDHELSFLMCNLARVKPGNIVFDPFCGTCSILISATALGAICVGGDLDIKILRGKQTTYVDSFTQYSLPYADLSWQDASQLPLKCQPLIDAIICDPPYHIRASSKKQSYKEKNGKKSNFGAKCDTFSLKDLILNLVATASTNLVLGGRLVFWLPVPARITDFGPEDLPVSQNLKLICWPEQPISSKYARKLIIYEKVMDNANDNVKYVQSTLRFENIRQVVALD